MPFDPPRPAPPETPAPTRRGAPVQLGVLLLAWAALHRAPLGDVLAQASTATLYQNLLLGLVGLGLVLHRGGVPSLVPAPRLGPLAVVAACAVAHLGMSRTLDIDLLSCTSMVLGAWGLLGLFVPAARWRRALPLALVGVCILPLGSVLDVYLGFPLRLGTARVVAAALQPLGLGSHPAETIVLVEGAGAQIDVPCSGVRSLWSGALLWAAATWIERRRIGLAWLGAGLVFAGLLVAFNGVRVLALVMLHTWAPAAMDVLHVPLGLIAFGVAGLLGWLLLRRMPAAEALDAPCGSTPAAPSRPLWGLALALGALALLPPASAPGIAASVAPLELSDPQLRPLPLGPQEATLFRTRHAEAAGKWSFDLGDAQGQLVMVRSRSFRAQHRPDLCHGSAGRTVEHEAPVLLAPDVPARLLRLRQGSTDSMALYWFQSAERTTNDYGERVWAALDGDAEDWVMVSVLVQPPRPLDDPVLAGLLRRVHAHAAAQLAPEPGPTDLHPGADR